MKNERILLAGCTHLPVMREGYLDWLLSVWEDWECTRFIHLGDLWDWQSISFHESHPDLPGAAEEYRRAKEMTEWWVDAFPEADLLIGNHDCLTYRRAAWAGIPSNLVPDYHATWGLPKSWRVHRRHSKLWLDNNTVVMHGESGKGGMYAAHKQAVQNFCNVGIAHLHTEHGNWSYANEQALVWGMSVGTGAEWEHLAQEYGRTNARKPVVGCGLIIEGQPVSPTMPIPDKERKK